MNARRKQRFRVAAASRSRGGERAPKRSFEARSDNTIGRCMRVRTYHEQIVGGTGTLPEQGGGGMLRIVEHDKAKGNEHL